VPPGYFDFETLGKDELENLTRELERKIARNQGELDAAPSAGERNKRLARGTLLNVAGLALAVPTGGISAILCVIGLWDWADAIVDDAAAANREIELRKERREIEILLAATEQKLEDRRKPK
jgi:hypothetical protein